MKSKNSFLSQSEIEKIGFKSFGKNVLISRYARFYSSMSIVIGDNVRIDDFCILSGDIAIGSFVHISARCSLFGSRGISIDDFSGISPHCVIFSESDDFSGEHLINPMVPNELRMTSGAKIVIEKYCQIGASTTILPIERVGEGAVVGALSLVNTNLEPWSIYAGIPVQKLRDRKRDLVNLIEKIYQ